MLEDAMRKQGVENPEEKVKTMLDYVTRNMENVMLGVLMQSMTIDDLRAINQMSTSPAYRHMTKALSEMSGNPIQLSIDLLGKVANWMDGHYPGFAAPVRQRATELEQVRQMMH